MCDVVRLCENCLKIVNTKHGQHECGISSCKQCSKRHAFNNACFMQPVGGGKNLKAEKKFLYIFYNFETRQDTLYGENARIHVPNIYVAHQVCTDCTDVDDLKIICSNCGVHEFIFTEDPVKELLNLCIRESTEFSEIVCIVHNAKACDAQFILKELAENAERAAPSVILSGQNITMLKYG